jgi:hypothetical protein
MPPPPWCSGASQPNRIQVPRTLCHNEQVRSEWRTGALRRCKQTTPWHGNGKARRKACARTGKDALHIFLIAMVREMDCPTAHMKFATAFDDGAAVAPQMCRTSAFHERSSFARCPKLALLLDCCPLVWFSVLECTVLSFTAPQFVPCRPTKEPSWTRAPAKT